MDNLINAVVGIAIVVFSLMKMHVTPNALDILLYAVAVGLGVAIHYSIMFFLVTISFWIVRAQGLVYGYYNIFNIARYPDSIFGKGLFRFVFSWIVPVIVVSNIPARLLGHIFDAPLPLIAQLAGAAALSVGISRAFWIFALRRYSSASS
jgi:ABC-2 type transport system permease protein